MGRARRAKTDRKSDPAPRPTGEPLGARLAPSLIPLLFFGVGLGAVALALGPKTPPSAPPLPQPIAVAGSTDARAAVTRARKLLDERKAAEAQAALEKARAQAPDDPDVAFFLGDAAVRLGHRTVAEEHFRRAAVLDPRMAGAHANLALVLIDLGRAREAADAARQAVALKPGDHRFEVILGKALLRAGQPREAADVLASAVAKVPDAETLAVLGRARGLLQQTEAAQQAFDDALRRDAQHPFVRYAHAEHLRRMGRVEEARREFEAYRVCQQRVDRLMRLELAHLERPKDAATLLELARLELERGDIQRAVAAVVLLEPLAPTHPELPGLKRKIERAATSGRGVLP